MQNAQTIRVTGHSDVCRTHSGTVAPNAELNSNSKVRVLIIDHLPLFRAGLMMKISEQPDMEVCAESADFLGAIEAIETKRPSVLIVDIDNNHDEGIEWVRGIKSRNRHGRIIVTSNRGDDVFAERAVLAGAVGHVKRSDPANAFIVAIRAVMSGTLHLSEAITNRLLERAAGLTTIASLPADLFSDRELQTYEMIGKGFKTQKIAEALNLSPRTVDTYRERIAKKLQLSGHELTCHAVRWVDGHS